MDDAQNTNDQLSLALEYLLKAIEQLDEARAPAHIGAHIDLAMHQLRGVITGDSEGHWQNQIDTNAEPH